MGGVHKDLWPFAVVYLYIMPFAFVLTALGLGLMIWLTRHSVLAPVLFIFGAILLGSGAWMRRPRRPTVMRLHEAGFSISGS